MAKVVSLIGFQDQGNLGLGYLGAVLERHGFRAQILDFREGPESILGTVRKSEPLLVGFSLIFQYYLPQFAALAEHLRTSGITCHFCAGGHFPALRPEKVLAGVPALDSIACGEGEFTLLELAERLAAGLPWRDVRGLAFRSSHGCERTPPRPLIADLDSLPRPLRSARSSLILGKYVAPLLASRGCLRRCTFCSIRQFYAGSPGRAVRVRRPAMVVAEMRDLHLRRQVSILQFQDDDFPLWGAFGKRWINEFLEELNRQALTNQVIWKISCRADQLNRDLLVRMRTAGLYMVYLGLESGNQMGLDTLRKGLDVSANLEAVRLLAELDIFVVYGFMLFDPSSTFASVRENLGFLRRICAQGTMPVLFCRMLPYAGTAVEESLSREKRLLGDVVNPDYAFLDPRMDLLSRMIYRQTAPWIHGPAGLVQHLNWAWHEYWICRRLFSVLTGLEDYQRSLRAKTRRCNEYLLDLVERATDATEAGRTDQSDSASIDAFRLAMQAELIATRDGFMAENQDAMLHALTDDGQPVEAGSDEKSQTGYRHRLAAIARARTRDARPAVQGAKADIYAATAKKLVPHVPPPDLAVVGGHKAT